MNAEIIVIGDELLIGQVTDTNSGWIARQMNRVGWEIAKVTAVRDRQEEIRSVMEQALHRVDVVLVTGGLGPTKDDITKQTLCDFFGGTLVMDETVLDNIGSLLRRRGLEMNDSTRSQAMVPDVCTVIQNPVGTAPVMWFEQNGKILISMPGVPSEMQQAMRNEVIPRLTARFQDGSSILHYTCLVKGYTESALSEYLTDFESGLPAEIKLAYLPDRGVVRLRLTARGLDRAVLQYRLDEQTAKLETLLGRHIFCHQDATLAGALGMLLERQHKTLATAESCTGGNIAHRITLVPGASVWFKGSVVSYANEVKEQVLGVNPEDIAAHGAVSIPVAEQMVCGLQRLMNVDCAIAVSGIAGPGGGTPEKPAGTVCIAVACGERLHSETYFAVGNRESNIESFTHRALLALIDMLAG
ncbi:MAG: competence/damage-inducible protein A [Coprobacter sp.]|nr:competence/damage-inducible protein A [Coprobacter sp.]